MTAVQQLEPLHRLDGVTMEGAFAVAAAVRARRTAGLEVLDLSIGEPGFATPAHIVDAATRALLAGDTRYVAPAGIMALREVIAASHSSREWDVSTEQVVVTPGAKPALLYALLALVEPGDEVLVPDPGFPAYAAMTHLAGATPVSYPATSTFDAAAVRELITSHTRVLIINSPHNPTGKALSQRDFEAVAALADEHGLQVISDEVYSRLWYGAGGRAPGAERVPALAARTVLVDGFSKSHSMTGWRLGYCVAPRGLADTISRIAVNAHSCVAPFVQRAGVAALEGPDPVPAFIASLAPRRALLVDGLRAIPGVRCSLAEGAFYAFADFGGVLDGSGLDADDLARTLLNEQGVAVVPGSAFSDSCHHHLRFSFAAPRDVITSAIERVAAVCAALPASTRSSS